MQTSIQPDTRATGATGSGGPSLNSPTEEPWLDKSPARATRFVGLRSREGSRLIVRLRDRFAVRRGLPVCPMPGVLPGDDLVHRLATRSAVQCETTRAALLVELTSAGAPELAVSRLRVADDVSTATQA
jgi:hypothetical protein